MEITTTLIGAGVVGLAVAAQLSPIRKGIMLLERNPGRGQETASRNSEMIHAGIESPGPTASPAIGRHVAALMAGRE
ncbi:hypothetical protein DSCA_43130 [Desulfosarcina alkanivorans]|uniref:FAD dependent oxidoreductase domain-containing protein n=1 Tax=Desulfosarcina alkanivorans TaxID=571177 RepID=A0A5K7YPW1_9BACT|nr:FAD-dependent oxidoreductase [Desulfosarcina alkanivorans]BBO70383.1 hypothetical protein DSCA_43130 [Desulfosarcina alkanivorans]